MEKVKKRIGVWWLLMALAFVIMSGGCGGGSSRGGHNVIPMPIDPTPPIARDYAFSDLVGTWLLSSGSGTASGHIGGYPGSGTATAISGSAQILNMVDMGVTAEFDVLMTSLWSVAVNTPYGPYRDVVGLNLDSQAGTYDPNYSYEAPRKVGPNVFVYYYTESGLEFSARSTMTITLKSSTTADVVHKGEYYEYGDRVTYDVKYSVWKQY